MDRAGNTDHVGNTDRAGNTDRVGNTDRTDNTDRRESSNRPEITLLIVDDSALVRRNLRKLLTDQPGIGKIHEAHSVFSTIQQVETEHPDSVIVDLQLPDGSGFEVLEFLALQDPPPFTVVLTNYPSEQNRDRARALGVVHFLDKSFEYERLLEVFSRTAPGENGT